jgi:undecaprenyl diphosphate synthase
MQNPKSNISGPDCRRRRPVRQVPRSFLVLILPFAFCLLPFAFSVSVVAAAEEQPLPEVSVLKSDTLERLAAAGLEPSRMPRHVAIIMDGNGRWANQRSLPRIEGHRRGVQSVRAAVEEGCRLGLEQLTLYCLSIENWKRPQAELDFLMKLLRKYLIEERAEIMEQNIRFTTIGRREGLPAKVLREMDENIRVSESNTGMVLCLAINYGARTELVDAVRAVARRVQDGKLDPEAIDEDTVSGALYTAGMPDPDLLIRTAGEMRVSNYLLWQISYAELWVTDRCWPDFDRATFHAALRDFGRRERRYGGLKG